MTFTIFLFHSNLSKLWFCSYGFEIYSYRLILIFLFYNRGNKCWQKSRFTMFVTPFPPSLNVVIDLVAGKTTRFNTNTTLRSARGDGDYFWPKFLPRFHNCLNFQKFWESVSFSKIKFSFLKATILRVGKVFSVYILLISKQKYRIYLKYNKRQSLSLHHNKKQ